MKNKPIGIIAEDISDVNTVKVLIQRIANKNVSEKHHLGYGSGKILSKCSGWAKSLYQRNCGVLIVIHDSDTNPAQEIYNNIQKKLATCLFNKYLICIPIQELEAWLLSDPAGIKKAMNLENMPTIKGNPEDINSPKEYLERLVWTVSLRTKIYINTKHNEKIVSQISLDKVYKKCKAFQPFHKFIKDNFVSNSILKSQISH